MSVQAGIWNLDGEPVKQDLLDQFSQAMTDIGSDGETTYCGGPLGMLYRPFHTRAESRGENQPYHDNRGRVMTWDGRLDNRHELICQLDHLLTDDHTDAAILAAALEQWGTDCFAALIGDWALSIWDPQQHELILARDYMGIRHLFYYPKPQQIVWCSHLAPLALSGDRFSVSDEYVAGYLAFRPDAHLTPYSEIKSVPPGKFIRLGNAKATVQSHWTPNVGLKIRYKKDGDYEEHFRHLFRVAVGRRLSSDAPVLAELSGGLDSSSIVCMADDIMAREGAETPHVDTFSYYDSNDPDEDDLLHVIKVEEKRKRKGFHVDLAEFGDSFSLEFPVFSAIPGFGETEGLRRSRLELMRRNKYRVLLSGTGGDELLGQALDPSIQMADLLLRFRFPSLAQQLVAWSLIKRVPWIQILFQTLIHLMPLSIRTRLSEVAKLEPWLDGDFARRHGLSARRLEALRGAWVWSPTARDSLQTLATLARQLTQAQPSTYEPRYPYLDRTLIEFLISIPSDQLLRPGQRRSLMRRALVGFLPLEITHRVTKASSSRCYCVTLEKYWNRIEKSLSSSLSSRLGYIKDDHLRAVLVLMKNGCLPPYFLRPLRALSLELWLREMEARGVISIQASTTISVGPNVLESRPGVASTNGLKQSLFFAKGGKKP
jgi:asparagine synthase (glutamine-hydrolysing)